MYNFVYHQVIIQAEYLVFQLFFTIPTKRHVNQLKLVKDLVVETCKKRKLEASLIINSQPKIKDNILSMVDMSNMEDKSETWFWNDSTNESNSDIEEGEDSDTNESDLEVKKSRKVSLKICKEIKWNKKRENKLYGVNGIESKATSKRQQKFAQELDK